MKPRLRLVSGWWVCESGQTYHIGRGKSPLAAYAMWHAYQCFDWASLRVDK